MSAAGKMTLARTNLILSEPFFATLALKLEVVETRRVKTMATDAVHLFYNPDFVNDLPIAMVQGVICHEVLHCAAGHCWRRGGRDKLKWNYACDYAINPIVIEARYKLPDNALLDDAYDGMAAEQIYGLLPDSQDDDGSGQGKSGPGAPSAPSDDQGGTGGGQGGDPGDGLLPPDHNPEIDVLDTPAEQANETASDWRMSVIQAAKAAKAQGKLPAGLEREMLEAVRPKVDWRSLLRRFVQENARNDYTWRRPSTRYAPMGLYLPSMRSEQMPPVVVAIDTSGSVGGEELQAFRSELESIISETNPERTYVLYVDAEVARADEFEAGEPITFRPAGGGGTDFRPAFDWVAKNGVEPACLIYLTDMMGSFPAEAPEYPALWVATTDAVGPFGETVRMDM